MGDHFGYQPLVSVRSGAPVSMPGMMDTILNVGLNDANLLEWAGRIGPWAAVDSYRRLIQMLGSTAQGIDGEAFEVLMAEARKKDGVETDKEISLERLAAVVDAYKVIWSSEVGSPFPESPSEQLELAIGAVWRSWMNPRAMEYRDLKGIPHDMGTAVTVQAMVFGNMNDNSGSGVLFTRNPNTGERVIMAEYLACAQDEDVVAGIRTPDKLTLNDDVGGWGDQLYSTVQALETHFKDVQDVEFTVQDGKLYLLQTRSAKRSATAAVKIAHDMLQEKLIDLPEYLTRVTAMQYLTAMQPIVDPKAPNTVLATGLAACPGVAIGVIARTSEEAVELAKQGKDVILVTEETTPDDIAGMVAAKGILTSTGGATSHAAVVARSLDKPCIVGVSSLTFENGSAVFENGQVIFAGGTQISLDGGTGRVFDGEVPTLTAEGDPALSFLEDVVLASAQTLRRGSQPSPNADGNLLGYVCAADWFDSPKEGVEAFLDLITNQPMIPGRLILDLAEPQVPDDDVLLWVACGSKALLDRRVAWLAAIGDALLAHADHLKGLLILNPADVLGDGKIEMLRKAGVKFAGVKAQTVADLLSGSAVEITDEFVETVIGGDAAWAKLQKLLPKVDVFQAPVTATVAEAAFRVLA